MSEDSLARKISSKMAVSGMTAEHAANGITDVNRYTGIFDNQTLISKANEIRSELEENGFEVIRISNSFGKPGAYQGLHFVFGDSEGRIFELQFHTPQSIKIKNEIHPFYEEFRTASNGIRKSELARKMVEKWSGFIPPKDWEKIIDFGK